MNIADFLSPRGVIVELHAGHKREAIERLCRRVVEVHPGLDVDEMIDTVLDRERLGSTAVGEGIAIPHGKLWDLDHVVGCFARSEDGVAFESLDDKPVHLFFLLLAPETSAGSHLKALARISRLLRRPHVRRDLLCSTGTEEIYRILTQDDRTAEAEEAPLG